ncbi:hypothetical protein ACFU53_28020 [Streptomyces sp. NPDC057474]|uniref:hypothetical protein n=1 Tax=Streptomyces sp. NPDC057474 TaxID=3346144 RepID=UPI0036AD0802
MIAVPEPDLTERELVERAVTLRPALLERQSQTEESPPEKPDDPPGPFVVFFAPRYERMQRCFRDAATSWTHVGANMAEPLARRVGRDRLGHPSDDIALIP